MGADESGAFISGFFVDTLTVDHQVFVNDGGLYAMFVGKLGEDGSLEWAEVLRQDGVPHIAGSAAAADGSVYVAGGFQDTLWIDERGFAARNLADYFIARFDGRDLTWLALGDTVHTFHSQGSWIQSMDVHEEHVFVLGQNMDEQWYEDRGAFLARYSANGTLDWGVRINRQIRLQPRAEAVLADGEGGAYVAVSTHSGEIEVGDSTYATPYPWLIDRDGLALLRFDGDGLLLWVRILMGRRLGGAHLTARSDGGLYLSDAHWDTLYIDHDVLLPPAGEASSAFVTAINAAGEVIWVRTPPDSLLGVRLPASYSAGLVEGRDGHVHHFIEAPGGVNLPENDQGMPTFASSFRAKFDPNGELVAFSGLPAYDVASGPASVTVDGNGNLYAVVDQAVARLNLSGIGSTSEAPLTSFALKVSPIYPNPVRTTGTLAFRLPSHTQVRVSLFDVLGREVRVLEDRPRSWGRHELVIAADGLAAGLYFVRLSTPTGSTTAPVVIAR